MSLLRIKKVVHYQYTLWCLALSFLTRIPVRFNVDLNDEMLSQASRYFALVGVLIGSLLAVVFYGLQLLLPASLALIITIAINLVLTGAFHEDGWADVWDGFGGGWSVEQKLNIMKDSRIGTYGAAALVIILLLKYQSLLVLTHSVSIVFSVLIIGNCLSRANATALIYTMNYVREDNKTKVKPIAQTLSTTSLLCLLVTVFIVLLLMIWLTPFTLMQAFYLCVAMLCSHLILRVWFIKQLGGYTGDCLGAAQVFSEVIIYLTIIFLLNHELGRQAGLLNGVNTFG